MIYEVKPHGVGSTCCAGCGVVVGLVEDEYSFEVYCRQAFQREEVVRSGPGTRSLWRWMDGRVGGYVPVTDVTKGGIPSGDGHLPYYCEECVAWDYCMWCGEDFPNDEIEAHERECR